MQIELIENEIANIIKNYRSEESIRFNKEHVHKWVSQFEPESQEIILLETLHIFKKYYFNKNQIKEFFVDVLNYLLKKYKFRCLEELLENTYFINIQEQGKSQSNFLNLLYELLKEKYDINVKKSEINNQKLFIYVDDGLYTGSTIRKDMKQCSKFIQSGVKIEIFYLFSYENGLDYSKKEINKFYRHTNVNIEFNSYIKLHNDKEIKKISDNAITYDSDFQCLWPSFELCKLPIVEQYIQKLNEINGKKIPCIHRFSTYNQFPINYTKGIFSSIYNRNVVEKEFLLKGISIIQNLKNHKGLYPLGYNNAISLGFGSFCATDFNISNTCPVVLWWGNVNKTGDALDCWYPLLPRKINSNETFNKAFELPVL